jgi:hypothetical protein
MKTIQLDRGVLQNLYGDCLDNQIEIFSEFIASYAELKKNLFSAFDSGNLNSLKRVLHFHGPSFMYLGIPQVAAMFKNLELKCSQLDNHFSLSKDFSELMQAVEGSWLQATNEMEHFRKAV